MGELSADTAVTGKNGRYTGVLSSDWEIWGPQGGYVASFALRAAGAHVGWGRPATLMCQYLAPAGFGPVDLEVVTLRSGSRAAAVRVSMRQETRSVLEAFVWVVADGLPGIVHSWPEMPDVPPPEELQPLEKLLPPDRPLPSRFWVNLEERPLDSIETWHQRTAAEPAVGAWNRFRPTPCFDDPFIDGARLVILIDLFQWPAAARAHAAKDLKYIAPSLDLVVQFHAPSVDSEWLLCEGRSPSAEGGLVAGRARVWSLDGRLLASGVQQMLCRVLDPDRDLH